MSSVSTPLTSSQPPVPEQIVLATLPTIQTRLRAGEIGRLRSALKLIVCERAGHVLNGHSKNNGYWRVLPHRYPAGVWFDAELMNRTIDLWTRLWPLGQDKESKSRRFRLHAVDIWVLQLAIRMARHQEGHRGSKGAPRRRSKNSSRLMQKLDRLEKKARRAWLRSEQSGSCASNRSRWAKHQLWIRAEYGCLCRQPAIVLIQKRCRSYVDRGIEVAKQALREAEIQPPDDVQLRKFIRLAFREIRRGRQPFSIIEIVRGQEGARFFLSHFIRERLWRSGQLKYVNAN